MLKLDLEKAEEPDINLPTSVGSLKKQECSRKSFTSALLTTPKPLTVWITTNWKILQEMEYQTSWEFYMQVNKPVRTGHATEWFQIGKGVCQGCILSSCLFNLYAECIMRSAALNMPANLENSAMATGLENVSFLSNPQKRQCQRMLKLPHNCTHLTH